MAKPHIDPDLLPLTSEGILEERAFNAVRSKFGGQLRLIATGYVLTSPGVIQHFADLAEARSHIGIEDPDD